MLDAKILHVVPLARRAGLQVMFINYLRQIKKKNPQKLKEHIVFAINYNGDLINEVESIGVKCYKAKRSFKFDFRVIFQIIKIVTKYNIKIIYGQNSTGNIWASLSHTLLFRTKLICHEHGTAWSGNKVISLLCNRFWLWKSDVVIANSLATKSLLERKFNADKKKIITIYNGIPQQKLVKGVKRKTNQLLFVGRLDEVKSPEVIIDAISILLRENFNVNVVFLGEGPLLKSLYESAKKSGIQNMVTFKGSVSPDEVSRYMAESTYLILPSIRESLGNVIIEAAMQNTPAIATKVDGIPEVIRSESYGRLIKPEKAIKGKTSINYSVDPDTFALTGQRKIDPNDLAKVIIEELEVGNYHEKGIKAGQIIPKRHKMSDYADALDQLYIELLKKK
ncbi:glycosyltransferase [Evansella halocellulosilytica]|uniref:glycosyltransferase n=1 Tax=Evansella halocellulosilytica TaxID=2011013 RepID=UPI000BB8ED60|nr:glycosyltransferase [Evansella halocellulosilytica]